MLIDSGQRYCRRGSCPNSLYYFQAIQINVSISGSYIIISNSTVDTYGYLYGDGFIPSASDIYLISYNDDGGDNQQFKFAMNLQAMRNYILIVTTYNQDTTAPFSIIGFGPALLGFTHVFVPSKKPIYLHLCSK